MAEERVVLRRRHSVQVKALVLEQCAAPGASVAVSWPADSPSKMEVTDAIHH